MILGNDARWMQFLKDMDIKCYEWVWNAETWKKEGERSLIKLWLDPAHNVPRGFSVCRYVNLKDILEKTDTEGTVVHIQKLGTNPAWRNRGIGDKLLDDIVTTAIRTGVIFLATILHEENDTGRKWIMKRGFVAHGVHKEIYPDGRDGYAFLREVVNGG